MAWRSREHAVVRIFLGRGFGWTYGTGDSQHFDVCGGDGRVLVPDSSRCGGFVCH